MLYVAFAGNQYESTGGFGDDHAVFTDREEAIGWCKEKLNLVSWSRRDWAEVGLLVAGREQAEIVWKSGLEMVS